MGSRIAKDLRPFGANINPDNLEEFVRVVVNFEVLMQKLIKVGPKG